MTNPLNRTKATLRAGGLALGMGLRQARTVDIATIAGTCGFDWLFIDMEHGTMDVETASRISVVIGTSCFRAAFRNALSPGRGTAGFATTRSASMKSRVSCRPRRSSSRSAFGCARSSRTTPMSSSTSPTRSIRPHCNARSGGASCSKRRRRTATCAARAEPFGQRQGDDHAQ